MMILPVWALETTTFALDETVDGKSTEEREESAICCRGSPPTGPSSSSSTTWSSCRNHQEVVKIEPFSMSNCMNVTSVMVRVPWVAVTVAYMAQFR